MKEKIQKRRDGWASVAIAGASILSATVCGGCLYTAIPALAGPSTTYQQPADQATQSQAQPSQASNEADGQSGQQNAKVQSPAASNAAQAQGASSAP